MESPVDRVYRQSFPPQRRRFALWVAAVYLTTYIHAAVRPRVLRLLPSKFLLELYVRITSTVLMTVTLVSFGALVVAYYFSLRERRIHTAMSEFGLAVRATIAGVAGLAGFVLFLFINDGTFSP